MSICIPCDYTGWTYEIECCCLTIKDADGKVRYFFNLTQVCLTEVPTDLVQLQQGEKVAKLKPELLAELGLTASDLMTTIKECVCAVSGTETGQAGITPLVRPIAFQFVCRCLDATGEEHEIQICKNNDGTTVYTDLNLGTEITEADYLANYSKNKPEITCKCEEVIHTVEEGETVDYEALLEIANALNIITTDLGGFATGINFIKLKVEDKKGIIESGTLIANGVTEELTALEAWSFEHEAGTSIPLDFELTATKGCIKIVYSVYLCE